MEISEEIMKKVAEKEGLTDNFNRCIAMEVCPRCGSNLNSIHVGFFRKDFSCSSTTCLFEHIGF